MTLNVTLNATLNVNVNVNVNVTLNVRAESCRIFSHTSEGGNMQNFSPYQLEQRAQAKTPHRAQRDAWL